MIFYAYYVQTGETVFVIASVDIFRDKYFRCDSIPQYDYKSDGLWTRSR